jgi:hypothetical protein
MIIITEKFCQNNKYNKINNNNMKKLILTFIFGFISLVSFSQSQIDFVELTHDFGQVQFNGDTLVTQFWFKNRGTSDLEIYDAEGSCGCTIADYPKNVPVGTGGSITVKYYNANPGFINKSVTVTTNDPNNTVIVLRIKGETYKPE